MTGQLLVGRVDDFGSWKWSCAPFGVSGGGESGPHLVFVSLTWEDPSLSCLHFVLIIFLYNFVLIYLDFFFSFEGMEGA